MSGKAITAKVESTSRQHDIQADRDMMRALGMPMVLDELCDPVEVLKGRQGADTSDQWMREDAAMPGLQPDEVEEAIRSALLERVNH